ncbi:glycoside hydrolase superfamily [Powellomyces hirtus]|nr:glycoside hydrolase superfamily [Powellomyces hirtus]
MHSAWTVLTDDQGWGTAQEWSPQDPNSAATFSMQLVNPRTGRWTRRVGPPSSARPKQSRHSIRNRCLLITFAILTVAVVASIAIFYTVKSKQRVTFDPTAGPRGQLPAPPPGPPLPVLNMLDINSTKSTNESASVYFGASIDWSQEDPQSFNKALGHNAAIIDGYFMISETLERVNNVNSSGFSHQIADYYNWTAGLVGGTGAIMGMTIMPYKGLENVTLQAMMQLGAKCAEINQVGIPIMLRFAPEMNGNWYPWGQNPSQFRTVFRQLATIVRNATSPAGGRSNTTADNSQRVARTAIVWAPAAAQGYPFFQRTNSTTSIRPNSTRWAEMDTNNDTFVNELDDPYLPFYPGDAYVDWIGITALFNTTLGRNATVATAMASSDSATLVPAINNATNASTTSPSATSSASAQIPTPLPATAPIDLNYNSLPPTSRDANGTNGTSFESIFASLRWSLYSFALKREKPIVVGETGIGYLNGPGVRPSPTELEVKSTWWNQVYNTTLLKKYPLIRAIVWYDYALPIPNTPLTLDYSISRNETIMTAFRNTTNSLPIGTLVYANETMVMANDAANTTALGLTNGPVPAGSHRVLPVVNSTENANTWKPRKTNSRRTQKTRA